MMTTQVIFKIDKKIKEKAQQKAKSDGFTLSEVLKMATYAYVNGHSGPAFVSYASSAEQKDIQTRYGKKPIKKSIHSVSIDI